MNNEPRAAIAYSTGPRDPALTEHLRDHLTDGRWHDSCRWCLRRRVHGAAGVSDEQ
jgi:hypothetical protein